MRREKARFGRVCLCVLWLYAFHSIPFHVGKRARGSFVLALALRSVVSAATPRALPGTMRICALLYDLGLICCGEEEGPFCTSLSMRQSMLSLDLKLQIQIKKGRRGEVTHASDVGID
uniref:Uncharacterized protein n=1 Tax=Nymphaea colorata TaxID=210225 RepID=A0A5K1FNY5_9MAGN